MLPPKNRLTTDAEIKKVNAKSRPVYSRFLRLKALPNGKTDSRITVVISTKASKKATVRNRLKRQIREIIRLQLPKIKTGFDIVISIPREAIGSTYAELEAEVLTLWFKARLLK